MDQLPRLGKRELICLMLFTCNYVFFVWKGFLFLWMLGMGYVILLWHSLSLPYNYFGQLVDDGSWALGLKLQYDFLVSLPVHSGSLKRIDYPKQICLAHTLSFECFHCS